MGHCTFQIDLLMTIAVDTGIVKTISRSHKYLWKVHNLLLQLSDKKYPTQNICGLNDFTVHKIQYHYSICEAINCGIIHIQEIIILWFIKLFIRTL